MDYRSRLLTRSTTCCSCRRNEARFSTARKLLRNHLSNARPSLPGNRSNPLISGRVETRPSLREFDLCHRRIIQCAAASTVVIPMCGLRALDRVRGYDSMVIGKKRCRCKSGRRQAIPNLEEVGSLTCSKNTRDGSRPPLPALRSLTRHIPALEPPEASTPACRLPTQQLIYGKTHLRLWLFKRAGMRLPNQRMRLVRGTDFPHSDRVLHLSRTGDHS